MDSTKKRKRNRKKKKISEEDIFQINYPTGQWSPWNTQGKKTYGRRFLLNLRFLPSSVKKPDDLLNKDDVQEIVLKKCTPKLKCKLCTPSLLDKETFSDNMDPEISTLESTKLEVVFLMIPYDILLEGSNEFWEKVKQCDWITSKVELDLEVLTKMEPRKSTVIQTSVNKCDPSAPQIPNGRKKYKRDFLLKCHSHLLCQIKPNGLSNVFITLNKNPLKHTHCHVCLLEQSIPPTYASIKSLETPETACLNHLISKKTLLLL